MHASWWRHTCAPLRSSESRPAATVLALEAACPQLKISSLSEIWAMACVGLQQRSQPSKFIGENGSVRSRFPLRGSCRQCVYSVPVGGGCATSRVAMNSDGLWVEDNECRNSQWPISRLSLLN
eukprot:311515-Amphidinium_carterae.1